MSRYRHLWLDPVTLFRAEATPIAEMNQPYIRVPVATQMASVLGAMGHLATSIPALPVAEFQRVNTHRHVGLHADVDVDTYYLCTFPKDKSTSWVVQNGELVELRHGR